MTPFGAFGWSPFAAFGAGAAIIVVVLILWTLVWKGLALWHAARNGEKWWFIALLIINTAGILEIIYLFGFRKDRRTKSVFDFKNMASPTSSVN